MSGRRFWYFGQRRDICGGWDRLFGSDDQIALGKDLARGTCSIVFRAADQLVQHFDRAVCRATLHSLVQSNSVLPWLATSRIATSVSAWSKDPVANRTFLYRLTILSIEATAPPRYVVARRSSRDATVSVHI